MKSFIRGFCEPWKEIFSGLRRTDPYVAGDVAGRTVIMLLFVGLVATCVLALSWGIVSWLSS